MATALTPVRRAARVVRTTRRASGRSTLTMSPLDFLRTIRISLEARIQPRSRKTEKCSQANEGSPPSRGPTAAARLHDIRSNRATPKVGSSQSCFVRQFMIDFYINTPFLRVRSMSARLGNPSHPGESEIPSSVPMTSAVSGRIDA